MSIFLDVSSKFPKLSGTTFGDTAKTEVKFLKRMFLPKRVHDRVRPVCPQRRRIYGLPKNHKVNVPLRPIVVMVGLVLVEVFDPVLQICFWI